MLDQAALLAGLFLRDGLAPDVPGGLPKRPALSGDAVAEEGVVDGGGQILRTLESNARFLGRAGAPRRAARNEDGPARRR